MASPAGPVEYVQETDARVQRRPDLDDKVFDQKLDAYWRRAVKNGKRSISARDVGTAFSHPSEIPLQSADLDVNGTQEIFPKDIENDQLPEAAGRPEATATLPTSVSPDEIAESLNDDDDDDVEPVYRTAGQGNKSFNSHGRVFDLPTNANNLTQKARNDTSFAGYAFGQISLAGDSIAHFGHIINYLPNDLFGGLQALDFDDPEDAVIRYRQSRASIQSISNLPTMPMAYMPHAYTDQPGIKRALIRIAVVCQNRDAGFAEYFRVVVGHLRGTKEKIGRIREQIYSRQSGTVKCIGSFGEYCERINALDESDWSARKKRYQTQATGDETQSYLQDALEVPYWNMMADLFIKSSRINDNFTYDAVLSVINDKLRELTLRLQQAKERWPDALPQEIEAGIRRRIAVLEALLAQTSDKYDSLEEQQVIALQRSPTSGLSATSLSRDSMASQTSPVVAKTSITNGMTDLEKVSLLSLFFLFTAIAMVPFGMGFAGNWNADPSVAVGSTSDPDLKWLIATTLLSVLGNVYAIVALRKITRGSLANTISQVFLYLSIVLGIISISSYPFLNKAWSSSLSFFCSFFAIGSVFISAQHTRDTATGGSVDDAKVKKE